MKLLVLPLAAVAAAGWLASSPVLRAESSAITLRVEPSSKTEMDKGDHYTKTQSHSLKILVSNTSQSPVEIRAKYIFFGRNVKDHSVDKINDGEKTAQLKPLATETVDVPPVTSSYTEEHMEITNGAAGGGSGKGGGAAKAKPAKKIEASGSRFIGYAVQVFQGETLVAEAYEPQSMKDEVSKAATAPKGAEIKAQLPPAKKK